MHEQFQQTKLMDGSYCHYYSKSHTVHFLQISTEDNHLYRTISGCSVLCSILSGVTHFWFWPETWHLLAFIGASMSGVTSWVAAHFRMPFKCCCNRLERSFVLLMIWYDWGNLTKDTDKMCLSQLRQISPSHLSHAVQVYYFKLNVDRQIRDIRGEWQAENFEVFL